MPSQAEFEYNEHYWDTPCNRNHANLEDEDTSTEESKVNHPNHYCAGKYECIDVMVEVFGIEATQHFCLLNAFKYLFRANKKNGIEDIRKALWYLNYYDDLEEAKND